MGGCDSLIILPSYVSLSFSYLTHISLYLPPNMTEDKFSVDIGSLFEPVKGDEDIDLDFDSDDMGEFEYKSTMTPPLQICCQQPISQ